MISEELLAWVNDSQSGQYHVVAPYWLHLQPQCHLFTSTLQPGGEKSLIDGVCLSVEMSNRHGGVQHLPDVRDIVEDGRGKMGDCGTKGATKAGLLCSHSFYHVARCGKNCLG